MIDVKDLPKVIKSIYEQDAKINVAALNDTAWQILTELKTEIKGIYRNPSPFVLNSFQYVKATESNQMAIIKTKEPSGGTNPANIHFPNIDSGQRKKKAFEIWLDNAGAMTPKTFFVPTAHFPKNQYGSPKRSIFNKILSQFSALDGAGFKGSESDAKRSKQKRQSEAFFLSRANDNVIIYQRKGREIKPFLISVDDTEYKSIFPYEEIVDDAFEVYFPKNYERVFEKLSGIRKWI